MARYQLSEAEGHTEGESQAPRISIGGNSGFHDPAWINSEIRVDQAHREAHRSREKITSNEVFPQFVSRIFAPHPSLTSVTVDVTSGRSKVAQRGGGEGARGDGAAAARARENEEALAIRGHPGTGHSQDAATER